MIDPKFSSPTLNRHLKYLKKGKYVKKTRKRKQFVVYSLDTDSPLITKDDIEFVSRWYKDHDERFSAMSLEEIVHNMLIISRLLELEMIKIWLQRLLSKQNPEFLTFRATYLETFYKQFGRLLQEASKDKTTEYGAVLSQIEHEIEYLKGELFEAKTY